MPNQYIPYMQMMDVPSEYSPIMEMPREQLESMYPKCYYIIYPEVHRHCDMFCAMYGTMYNPSRKQLEGMVDEIDNSVGSYVDAEYQERDEDDAQNRQIGLGVGHFGPGSRRRFRRDLITILLLRELFHRRRPHYYGGYPLHYGGGYIGGYPY